IPLFAAVEPRLFSLASDKIAAHSTCLSIEYFSAGLIVSPSFPLIRVPVNRNTAGALITTDNPCDFPPLAVNTLCIPSKHEWTKHH
ncbi:hypothetical protein ACHAXS_011074, partial [Conticribra weissflogii]